MHSELGMIKFRGRLIELQGAGLATTELEAGWSWLPYISGWAHHNLILVMYVGRMNSHKPAYPSNPYVLTAIPHCSVYIVHLIPHNAHKDMHTMTHTHITHSLNGLPYLKLHTFPIYVEDFHLKVNSCNNKEVMTFSKKSALHRHHTMGTHNADFLSFQLSFTQLSK